MDIETIINDSLLSNKSGSFNPIEKIASNDENVVDIDKTVDEQISEFYKLKQIYENKIQNQKNSILKNDKLTLTEKQNKYRRLTANCVNCARKVGTIFESKENRLTAICGDKTRPCKLNINIHRGAYINLEELMNIFQTGVNDLKEEIITVKLDLLFGYDKETQVLEKFNKLKDDLSSDLEAVMLYKTQYISKVHNLDNKPILDTKLRVFYDNVSVIKSTIEEFNETGQIQLIRDMLVLYDTEMLPLLDEIRDLKYKHVDMESRDGNFKLIRKTFTLQDMMYAMETPYVESFVIG
tara:strand:- start:892 stop:1776 length:885 start_codon:yes stop_codon:yes gene_type:complete